MRINLQNFLKIQLKSALPLDGKLTNLYLLWQEGLRRIQTLFISSVGKILSNFRTFELKLTTEKHAKH